MLHTLTCFFLVPTPNVSVTASVTPQTVNEPVTLQCEVTTVRGITSRVDVVWGSDDTQRNRINISSTTMDNSLVYRYSYTILQVNTTDDDRVFECEIVINTNPLVMASSSITLNVTSEYMFCNAVHSY